MHLSLRSSGRYGVKYSNRKNCLGVKSANLALLKEVEFRVVRCNVQGGGTLEHTKVLPNSTDRLSFEWLEEAVPEYRAAYEGDLASDDHPMNLAKKVNWNTILTETPGTLQDKIKKEHQDLLDLPIGTNRMDPSYLQRWESVIETFRVDEWKIDPMKAFPAKLSLLPIAHWGPVRRARSILSILDLNTAEMFLQCYENLKGTEEYETFVEDLLVESKKYGKEEERISGFPSYVEARFESAMSPADAYHDAAMLFLSEKIGIMYEESTDYFAAIRWYEKDIEYIPEELRRNDSELPDILKWYSRTLNNLGLAQKRPGLFHKALDNYNLALRYGVRYGDGDGQNRAKLLAELEMWKGTSGELTTKLEE